MLAGECCYIFVLFCFSFDNINFAIFALYNDSTFVIGHVAVIISIALAAAEAAIGLGIILSIYRTHGTVDATDFVKLKG